FFDAFSTSKIEKNLWPINTLISLRNPDRPQDNDVPTLFILCCMLPDMEVLIIFLCKQETRPFYQDVSGELL
ncbi:MAG: hypothetical protein LC541_20320, partial [Candidatus Thiodiazotropha sp.]|nr:hypothetical protein [Candidatus Thiodiazotropha sp.]MCM8885611.1 hypothetical protein [Candidatus Thiodiazotropha sp.]